MRLRDISVAIAAAMLLGEIAAGQSPQQHAPAFEVASVKPSSPRAAGVRMRRNPGLVDYSNVTLAEIIADAYNLDWQLVSGPS
ncbi:MAG TPA: hypothetical protein VN736_29865 [Candidatus Limnocylindrales bacterium]|nr:hypothetical protein [Candidatus Limnocylindrales bacterium]